MREGIGTDHRGLTGRRRAALFFAALFIICAGLSGCGNVPSGQRIIDREATAVRPPVIAAPKGFLSPAQSARLIKKAGVPEYLMHHLSIAQAVNEEPLTAGNSTRILIDGDDTFSAVFKAMEGAHDSIDLEFYIFEDVEDGHESLADLLIRKRREGVAVNVIYDGFGSAPTPTGFFDALKKAGVRLVQYNPVDPFEAKRKWAPNHRDHRKILVVDGRTAFTGGVNLSTTYESSWSGKSEGTRDLGKDYWHDTDLEIRGPAVAEVQRLFFEHWKSQKGPAVERRDYFPPLGASGDELIRVIGSKAGNGAPDYYVTLLSALQSARSRIWLTAAYFVPTQEQVNALLAAAGRGVDVRVLVPNRGDSLMATLMQHAQYAQLLKGGVKIFETHGEVLHSKSIVIDGVWSVIGSSNFDQRSVVFNDEADVVILGSKTGAKLEEMFRRDCARAQQVTWRKWKHRPFLSRLKETLAPLGLAIAKVNL